MAVRQTYFFWKHHTLTQPACLRSANDIPGLFHISPTLYSFEDQTCEKGTWEDQNRSIDQITETRTGRRWGQGHDNEFLFSDRLTVDFFRLPGEQMSRISLLFKTNDQAQKILLF